MSSITMDPPHVVHTGVACTACCTVAPGKLLRCGACDSAWYCNQDCQRKHFKEHKPFCRALRLFHALQADLPPASWPRTVRDFYMQRTNCQQILEPMLRRSLSRGEMRALLGEAHCSVCMRTRGQLPGGAAAAAAASAAAAVAPTASAAAESPPAAALQVSSGSAPSPAAAAEAAAAETTELGTVQPSANSIPTNVAPAAAAAATAPSSPAPAPQPPQAASPESRPAAAAATTLTCCPHCNWGWVCSEHCDSYLSGPHAAVCQSYQHMNDSQLLTHRYLTATGRLPNYVPDKLRPAGPWEPVPPGWVAFQAWRPMPSFDPTMMCVVTKRVSQALTVVQALQHHYTPPQLAAKSHLEIHVIGASAFEVPADRIWEEILNLMPPWDPAAAANDAAPAATYGNGHGNTNGDTNGDTSGTTSGNRHVMSAAPPRVLHVAFVGPELREIIVEESDGRVLPQGTSLSSPPPPPGHELLYSYHLCTYQEFARGRRPPGLHAAGSKHAECTWRRPDLAVAFNSGIYDSEKRLWAPALELLVRHGVPVVFTSYNGEEAAADSAAWKAAGGVVTLGPEPNPFRALEPIAEPSQVDAFYYQNYHWWCGRTDNAK